MQSVMPFLRLFESEKDPVHFSFLLITANATTSPITIPMKLHINSSTSRLLPNISCSISKQTGTEMAANRIFFQLLILVTSGRKKPSGANIAILPISIVLTQLPMESSPFSIYQQMGLNSLLQNEIPAPFRPTSREIVRHRNTARN